jgi:hypothetical protein
MRVEKPNYPKWHEILDLYEFKSILFPSFKFSLFRPTYLSKAFGIGETVPILLAASSATPGEPILSPTHIATLFQLVNDLKNDPQIADIYSLFNLDPKLNLAAYQQLYQKPEQLPPPLAKAVKQLSSPSTTLIIIKGQTGSNNADSKALIKKLRGLSPVELRLQVGGAIARQLDTIQVVAQRFPIVLAAMQWGHLLAYWCLSFKKGIFTNGSTSPRWATSTR